MDTVLKSENITVFPSINRSADPKSSRLFTEYNLVKLINQLTDTKSFLISEIFVPSHPFEFNINGYYFKVDAGHYITDLYNNYTDGDKIYAEIIIKNNELQGFDIPESQNSQSIIYDGVTFHLVSNETQINTYEKINDEIYYRLILLTYKNNNWVIYDDSRIKFSSSIGIVDGGTI